MSGILPPPLPPLSQLGFICKVVVYTYLGTYLAKPVRVNCSLVDKFVRR